MIDPKKEDIGRRVLYRGGFKYEVGKITSFNKNWVFVAYSDGGTPKATRRHDLHFVADAGRGAYYVER